MSTSNKAELSAFKAAIDEQHAAIGAAFDRGDAQFIGEQVFNDSAWLVGDGDDGTYYGSQAVADVFLPFVSNYTWKSESVRYGVSGTIGYDFANAVATAVNSDEVLTFKLLFIWENIDRKWVATGQMYVNGSYKS